MRVTCAVLVGIVAITGCGKKTDPEKGSDDKKVRVIQNDEDKEQTEEAAEESAAENDKKFLVAIDPGHQAWDVDMSAKEPNAPGSDTMKAKATSGTSGKYTGIPEYELCLDISFQLKDALQAAGYEVVMTREDNETAISNAERAQLANDAGADVMIRIHANGSEDTSVNGALALITSQGNPNTAQLYDDSRELAEDVLGAYCESTEMKNLGIQENDTMTGLNWSRVPVMILEMGFMTNEQDDRNMADENYRDKMVTGIVNGIEKYRASHGMSDVSKIPGLESQLESLIQERRAQGELWGVCVEKMSDHSTASAGDGRQEAASLIKLYIAATVYQHMESVTGQERYDGETDDLLRNMIRVSDNDAANTLVRRLGNGDAMAGMKLVNDFCAANGYTDTHMGRLLLDFNATDDNYTSPQDCVNLLIAIEENRIDGAALILGYMKEQERRGKIPAGLPTGVESANKTGELDDAEHDAAVVFTTDGDYVICVMSSGLKDTASARAKITEISSMVYQTVVN